MTAMGDSYDEALLGARGYCQLIDGLLVGIGQRSNTTESRKLSPYRKPPTPTPFEAVQPRECLSTALL